ncbi:TonB-dependent receptor [Sphingomonas sp. PL-96]|uniref:TonB-dependent receptor n=1 Tax=Sphingomonas sp. PL-96 TaxID=2887201 RepID=UPI001E2999AB|nr:TonB-dependent receptor [Sphingomonas sp. PL-96]MCC2976532.1 TonB-dependent receptor [Sphingomonas sp. PL-96]
MLLSTTLISSTLLVTPAQAQDATPPQEAPAGSADGGLGDIVVTAQRTSQSVQKVPVAVTAITSEALEKLQITSAKDIGQIAPNVQITTTTGGSAGIVPFIRGGGVTDGSNITSEPEVGVYIDDVYQPRTAASFIEALDVERIEVLRGPQGTLYGRNSSAGALKIVTREPGETTQGRIEIGAGSWDEFYGKAAISGPVTKDGDLRAGFSGIIRDRDGGRQYNATLDKKVGAESYQGFQGDVVYDKGDIKARLKGFYSHLSSDGLYAVGLDPTSTETDYKAIQPTSGSYRVVNSPREAYTDVRQYGTSLNVTAQLSNTVELASISAWSKLTDAWTLDFSGGTPNAALGIPGEGYTAQYVNTSASHQTALSQELQLRGTALNEFLSFVGGLYYFREAGAQNIRTELFGSEIPHEFNIVTNSYAAFGQVGLHFTPELTLNLGGRYTEDHKSLDATISGVRVVRHDKFKDFLPKASLDYQALDNLLLYASYSEGFKAGGYNGLSDTAAQVDLPFAAQKVKAYELGFKSEFFDHHARLNVSAFINDYSSIQQQLVTDEGVFLTQNYAARHKGIEAELNVRPIPALTLWANGVYNDGKYKESADEVANAASTFVGNEMTNVFKYQATVGADLSLAAGPGTFLLGANYNARSDYYSTPDNSFYGHVPATDIVNAYVGYDLDDWSLKLNVKNLTDDRYWTTGFGFSVIRPRFLGDPRTWRVSLSKKF